MSDLKSIDRRITAIRNRGEKLNTLIQETAVDIIRHAADHGDCTRALSLVQAMPASFRRTKLINFFSEFSPIGMDVKKGKVGFKKNGNPFNVDGAVANPWFEDKPGEEEKLPNTLGPDQLRGMIFSMADNLKKIRDGKSKSVDLAEGMEDAVILAENMLRKLGQQDFRSLAEKAKNNNAQPKEEAPVREMMGVPQLRAA